MSKDTDKPSGQRSSRRRRKGSGIRIPSDNVPRRYPRASSDGGSPARPVTEDPMVVASVAREFGSDEDSFRTVEFPAPVHAQEQGGANDDDGEFDRAKTIQMPALELDDDEDSRETTEMPSLSEQDIEVRRADTDEADAPPGMSPPPDEPDEPQPDEPQAESVDISLDDSVDIPLEAVEEMDRRGDAVPVTQPDTPQQQSQPRATTVALSEEDLEEVIEAAEAAGFGSANISASQQLAGAYAHAAYDPRSTQPLPVVNPDGTVESSDEAPRHHAPKQATQNADTGVISGEMATVSDEPAVPDLPGETHADDPDLPPTLAAVEKAAQRPVERADVPDSGEILADELIEEVSPPPRPPAPPPTPAKLTKPSVKPPPAPRASDPGGRQRKGRPWFEEIFDEDYLRTLPFLTQQATQAEASFVADALEVPTGGQLLDVGCGYGRHAMELAARGYHIVALDASLPLLLRGADEAQRRSLNINFVHGDMRELAFDVQFDGAYCLFSTFGYFDDETNKKVIQGVGRALRPKARLVVQVLNRDYLIADLPCRVWWEGDGCVVLEEVEFNYFSSRIVSNRSVVFDDGRQLEQEISMRAYSLHEFGKLLHAAGFRVLEISGSMVTKGRFFGNHSREIIVVAEKREMGQSSAEIQLPDRARSS